MKIFIAGSRCISSLDDYTCAKLRSIYDKGYDVLIGDCYGADTLIQHFFYTLGYKQVTIYASLGHARNNIGNWKVKAIPIPKGVYSYRLYETKDIAMADEADFGFMIWDGESEGTRKNIERLIGRGNRFLFTCPTRNRPILFRKMGHLL